MKVAYAVTSAGRDGFSAMTRISIVSLRHFNPGSTVLVAVDSDSLKALSAAGDPLLEECDEVLEIATPPGDAQFRNRFVKTSLRERIEGPFLFLDSDTLIRGDIGPVFDGGVDIRGALNHSQDKSAWQIWEPDMRALEQMGWKTMAAGYINGGVIFYDDTDKARAFGRQWQANWLQSCGATGRSKDQPALNAALERISPRFGLLAHPFNAQIKCNPATAPGALIWHYNSSVVEPPMTHVEVLVERVSRGESLETPEVIEVAGRDTPWLLGSGWIDRRIHSGLGRLASIDPATKCWLQGRRGRAVRAFCAERAAGWYRRLSWKFRGVQKVWRPQKAEGNKTIP